MTRDADEYAVDHGQLGEPAGRRPRPEGGLTGRRGQHEVGGRGDGRTRVAAEREGGGAASGRHGERVKRFDGGSTVRDTNRYVTWLENRRTRQHDVRIGPRI